MLKSGRSGAVRSVIVSGFATLVGAVNGGIPVTFPLPVGGDIKPVTGVVGEKVGSDVIMRSFGVNSETPEAIETVEPC